MPLWFYSYLFSLPEKSFSLLFFTLYIPFFFQTLTKPFLLCDTGPEYLLSSDLWLPWTIFCPYFTILFYSLLKKMFLEFEVVGVNLCHSSNFQYGEETSILVNLWTIILSSSFESLIRSHVTVKSYRCLIMHKGPG